MKKIELEIAQISHSIAHTNSFALLLEEKKGVRRLPIVIGGFEAQSIAIGLEKVPQSRPQTHDLIRSLFDQFNITLREVIINNLVEGVFYALAVRFDAPIYAYEFIMEQAGIILENSGTAGDKEAIEEKIESVEKVKPSDYAKMETKELNELLQKFIDNEDYERAARVRDELNRRK
jgi:uncharacterized protein